MEQQCFLSSKNEKKLLFVLSYQRIEENNAKKDHRDSFSHYYVPSV